LGSRGGTVLENLISRGETGIKAGLSAWNLPNQEDARREEGQKILR